MPRTAWTLTDSSTGSPVVYSFPVNPNTHSPPGRSASVQTDRAVSPDGQPIIFQGRDAVASGTFGGVINSQTMFNEIKAEASKHYPMVLTDDTANTWNILITEFSWERVKRQNDWRYDYTVKYIEVS